jgi:hypothetical protein
MNWFEKIQLRDLLKTAGKASSNKHIIKTAANGDYWDNQEGDWHMFGNVNRYRLDAYAIKVFLSRTQYNWTISLMTNHAYLGTAQYNVFWRYGLDEEKRARKTYREVNKVVKETVEYFIDEERPSSLFDCTLRSRIQKIDNNDLVHTNIPIINYSYDIDYSKDWDKNIYGPRYPHGKPEESFSEYLNSSIFEGDNPPTGKFLM